MRIILITCFLFPIFNYTHGQAIDWVEGKDFLEIADKVLILKDSSKNLGIEKVALASFAKNFSPSKQSILHFGFSQSVYWLKFTIANNTTDSLWMELEHAFIPEAAFYFRTENGRWDSLMAGYKVKIKNKLIRNHNQVFPLQSGTHEYYIRFTPLMHPIPVKIWNSKIFQIIENKQKLIYGIYVGILFFAAAINIFLFFTLKRGYYFFYSLLIILYIFSSAAVMEGYIVYFFPTIDLMICYKFIPVLDMPALLIYCISILDLKSKNKILYNIFLGVIAFLLLYIICLFFIPLLLALLLNYIYAVVVFIMAICAGLSIGKKGFIIGYYFTAAYLIWFFLLFIELIYIQLGKPVHIFSMSYVSIAIFVEAFLLAFLLAKRFQWERNDQEIIKENLQINILTIQQNFQQELLQTQLEIQEQTLKNISEEIHDNVGQVLSLAKLNLFTFENDKEPKLQSTKNLVSKAINDLRNLSRSMHGDIIAQLGLQQSITNELTIIENTRQFVAKLKVSGIAYKLDQQKEMVLFRIVQEALNNCIKYSKAKIITVGLNYESSDFLLTVADDGIGFNISNTTGIGLKSMQNRAALIGGKFDINSSINYGTTIIITLPKEMLRSQA